MVSKIKYRTKHHRPNCRALGHRIHSKCQYGNYYASAKRRKYFEERSHHYTKVYLRKHNLPINHPTYEKIRTERVLPIRRGKIYAKVFKNHPEYAMPKDRGISSRRMREMRHSKRVMRKFLKKLKNSNLKRPIRNDHVKKTIKKDKHIKITKFEKKIMAMMDPKNGGPFKIKRPLSKQAKDILNIKNGGPFQIKRPEPKRVKYGPFRKKGPKPKKIIKIPIKTPLPNKDFLFGGTKRSKGDKFRQHVFGPAYWVNGKPIKQWHWTNPKSWSKVTKMAPPIYQKWD